MKRYRFVLLLVLLVSSAWTLDACAQWGGFGGGRSGRADRGNRTDGSGREGRQERVVMPEALSYEQTEYRLSQLQQDLKLTTEQNKDWSAFADKVRSYAGDLARERARTMAATASTGTPADGLQHLGQAVDAARNRLTALEDVEASAKALFQTLTPDQKTLLDLRIPTLIAPRPMSVSRNGPGGNPPDGDSGSARSSR